MTKHIDTTSDTTQRARQEHPCLVPYGDLSESDKEYDSNTVRETLKAVLVLAYRIEKAP